MFSHAGLYTPWAVQPLTVASAADRFAKCEMSASLLSNDQASIHLNTHWKQCRLQAISHFDILKG